MSATGVLTQLAEPFVVTNVLTTFYTVTGSVVTRVKQILLMNHHTVNINVDLYIPPAFISASGTNKMFKGSAPSGLFLRPGETKILDLDTVLVTGESIQLIASIGNQVIGCISGIEITGTTLYRRLWEPARLPTYTFLSVLGYAGNVVPAATKLRLKEIILMNDHTNVVDVNMYIVPSGGAPVTGNQIFKGRSPYGLNLQPGETKILGLDQVLETGQSVQFWADSILGDGSGANLVSCRGSGLEIT